MILALDVGNSNIYGGVFKGEEILLRFRKDSTHKASSDEIGLFLRSVLRENNVDPDQIEHFAICSVVPSLDHTLRNCSRKYFDRNPFVLQPGVKTGLKVRYHNPHEVGSDRIANAIAATHLYPGKDLILIDFGTATTFCAVSSSCEYLGGVIVAGLGISAEALSAKTAKLPTVEIVKPKQTLGRNTVESIQAGLYFGNIGMVREITERLSAECFAGQKPFVVGTGGIASLFADAGIFDVEAPDLVLHGLLRALQQNV
jgi:type III pantothenate kinase